MPRPKKIEEPVLTEELIEQTIPGLLARIEAQKEQNRQTNDFRNQTVESTSLLLEPVEWALKKQGQKDARWCVNFLRGVVMTFKVRGVFDQADFFLVDELVEALKSTRTQAA